MEDAEIEDLGTLLDSWAQAWEQEFERFSSAEDDRLSRVAERARQFASHGLQSYQESLESQILEEDGRARQKSRMAGEELGARQAHAVAELKHDAEHDRRQAYHDAIGRGNDLVRSITESTAARRQAREEKRREEKRQREAAAEERRRQREGGGPKPSAAGPRQASAGPSARARVGSEPPKPRRPGASGSPQEHRRLDSWAAYDAAWQEFEKKVSRALEEGSAIAFADIPWPTLLSSVAGLAPGDSGPAQKEKLRAAVLRWHPDKWGRVMELVPEDQRGKVMDSVKGVTQRIIEERKKLGR